MRCSRSQVTSGWDWQGGRLQASAEDDLRTLLAFGPSFRLLIAHGVSDMITPYGMTRYVLDHLPPIDRPAARSSSSIAAGTCFISTRSRARRSARTPRRFTGRRGNSYTRSFPRKPESSS